MSPTSLARKVSPTSLARKASLTSLALLALLAACNSRGSKPTARAPGPTCGDVAVAAERAIVDTPPAERAEAISFYGEVIDLCQEPGLAQRARDCLAQAATFSAARACPSLPAIGDGSRQTGRAPAPSCKEVVAHAMNLLIRGSDAPDPADLPDEERLLQRDCGTSTPDGRRCAVRAPSVDALDECLTMPLEDDDESEDLDDSFSP